MRDFIAATGRPVIEKPFLTKDVRRIVAELATATGTETGTDRAATRPAPGDDRRIA